VPTFHLVVDELIPVRVWQFRVRTWRQAGQPPLVLFSQMPGHPPPGYCSTFLANFVLRNFLGYSLPIPVFFELSESKGQTRACRVRFQVLGAPLRPVLHKPTYTPLVPSAVEQLFQVKLDAPN
jgi:hypothetical protein